LKPAEVTDFVKSAGFYCFLVQKGL